MPYPVEVFKVELLEDGVSAFQLVPAHSPQVWQQLVPLLGAQPVRFASLGEGTNRTQACGGTEPAPMAALDTGDTVTGQLVRSNGLGPVDSGALPWRWGPGSCTDRFLGFTFCSKGQEMPRCHANHLQLRNAPP